MTAATLIMKNIVALIITVLMVACLNIGINLFCNWSGCFHWTNLFNHNLVCHGCINATKYMKDYQLMIYVSIGATIANELKALIDFINPINFKYEKDETNIPDTLKEYKLGKTSPHPRPPNHGKPRANIHD